MTISTLATMFALPKKSLVIFGNLWKISGKDRKRSYSIRRIFENLRKIAFNFVISVDYIIINKIIHGCLEIQNFFFRVQLNVISFPRALMYYFLYHRFLYSKRSQQKFIRKRPSAIKYESSKASQTHYSTIQQVSPSSKTNILKLRIV